MHVHTTATGVGVAFSTYLFLLWIFSPFLDNLVRQPLTHLRMAQSIYVIHKPIDYCSPETVDLSVLTAPIDIAVPVAIE